MTLLLCEAPEDAGIHFLIEGAVSPRCMRQGRFYGVFGNWRQVPVNHPQLWGASPMSVSAPSLPAQWAAD